MKCVLVCEDETAIREFIVINLRRSGYSVLEAGSGEEALDLFNSHAENIVIALLDVMLPGVDGFTVCKMLREKSRSLGIIMLTARTQESEKVGALKLGADDYITKPFSPSELLARVEALYRRVSMVRDEEESAFTKTRSGLFSLDFRTRTINKNEMIIELTQVEFQMMQFFFEREGETLERSEILKRVWGSEYVGEDKVVDVNIRRLRMKIEEDPSQPRFLQTVWGCGYRWIGQ